MRARRGLSTLTAHRPSRLAFQSFDHLCYPARPRPSPPPEHIPIPPHPTCCARLASEATQRAPPGPAQHVCGGGSPPCLLCIGLAAFVRRRAGISWWSTTRRTAAARGGATCLLPSMAARAPACGGIRSLVGLGVRTYRSVDRTGAQCTPVASSGQLAATTSSCPQGNGP